MSWKFDLGAPADTDPLSLGEPVELVQQAGSDNLRLNLDKTTEIQVSLMIDKQGKGTLLLNEL
jgi:hypothetical protein